MDDFAGWPGMSEPWWYSLPQSGVPSPEIVGRRRIISSQQPLELRARRPADHAACPPDTRAFQMPPLCLAGRRARHGNVEARLSKIWGLDRNGGDPLGSGLCTGHAGDVFPIRSARVGADWTLTVEDLWAATAALGEGWWARADLRRMNMKMRARQRWRKHRRPHCKLRQSKRSGSPCPNDIIKVCICCDFCRRGCALDAATAFLRQERNEPWELNASPAPWRTPLRPHPGHKNHENDPERGSSTRPPRRRSSRPRSQAPGILDCSRQLDASRSSLPNGHPAPPSVGMLDFRWTRGAVEIE